MSYLCLSESSHCCFLSVALCLLLSCSRPVLADIPEETDRRMRDLTVRAFHALKLNVYSRADFLLDEKGNLYCLEMNTLPGMTAASLLPKEAKAIGIEYGDLCELIIKKSLEARYS